MLTFIRQTLKARKVEAIAATTFSSILIFGLVGFFWVSPANITFPKKDHAHFRMQYIFHGKSENFAVEPYQQPYEKDQCNSELTTDPIHFHDSKNQIIHLHWTKITGGQVLKYYGLNLIGGQDDKLGIVAQDKTRKQNFRPVQIHTKALPNPQVEDKIWIFSGDEKSSVERETKEFVNKDLESFFGMESQARKDEEKYGTTSFLDTIQGQIKVSAHNNSQSHTETPNTQNLADTAINTTDRTNELINQLQNSSSVSSSSSSKPNYGSSVYGGVQKTQEELKILNNILGNVVIFVQKDQPTAEQVKTQFAALEPLSNSVCGG